MSERVFSTLDGNEAVASVAYRVNEVVALYPITPSSPMGEAIDAWASEGKPNLWGAVPRVVEMQSEGGAAGAMHGSLQAGSLTTTFTSSQGLLLMIPNMYKIAGELTPAVIHVAARALAAQALSIFGDHSDVMAARQTGWAQLASNSVQEAHDFALVSTAASLESRIPFLHFFDGFRTSHEVAKIEMLSNEECLAMIDEEWVAAHRQRALSPDHPVMRGTAQNPDIYFQARETVNPFYDACPAIVQASFDRLYKETGRRYNLYDYVGDPEADRVIIAMGSGCEAIHETVEYLNARGEKLGLVKVRLYRPFDISAFIEAIPASAKAIAVLDRTKEPGAGGEPLYLDVTTAISEQFAAGTAKWAAMPKIVGGRYGLSSKEFNPGMIKAVFDNLAQDKPKNHFTIGILDDISHTSLDYQEMSVEPDDVFRGLFYGLGADGTVGANKNSIKIIGESTENYAQGYFVYDSKKSGTLTVSHLRFGPRHIRSTYLVDDANFVACHQWGFIDRYSMLDNLRPGGVFLLSSPFAPEEVWDELPASMQQTIIDKNIDLYVINATKVASEAGMGQRINTIMQACFFGISGVLPREEAINQINKSIVKTYGRKGEDIVKKNLDAVQASLDNLHKVKVPAMVTAAAGNGRSKYAEAPPFVQEVLCEILAGRGDDLPVSAFPSDGTFPTGTSKYEKRSIAEEIPIWDTSLCIQCGKCAMVCPHSAIRIKTYDKELLKEAPATFKSTDAKDKDFAGLGYTIQVAPEDCTGCKICVDVCPAKSRVEPITKALEMAPQPNLLEPEKVNWKYFLDLPVPDRKTINTSSLRQVQQLEPLFEFSGACAGCGETPYIKLATQLFGDRMLVANATGCSSIYGGNMPTTPWTHNAEGRGPAWSNSLFEDNAEFGMGFRIAIDKHREIAFDLLHSVPGIPEKLVDELINDPQKDEADIFNQRIRVAELKKILSGMDNTQARQLLNVADYLVKKSVWIFGGDGWAYDIDFGGLDHVLASGQNVNILVLDTEVYSNTGGQMSKATPKGAVAKFAAGGKSAAKKDLGLIAMTYGHVYVASVAFGARDEHTLRAFLEAEAYDGPSLILAYSHCIAHGYSLDQALHHQKDAVDSGRWLLYRYNPDRVVQGQNPLQLDSREPKVPVKDHLYSENRFRMLTTAHPDVASELLAEAQSEIDQRWKMYEFLASRSGNAVEDTPKA